MGGFAVVIFDAPVRMFTDPLRKIRLGTLHALAERSLPQILDPLFLTLIGMRQGTNREYDGYQVHWVTPPAVGPGLMQLPYKQELQSVSSDFQQVFGPYDLSIG
jgi:hypothetical protein